MTMRRYLPGLALIALTAAAPPGSEREPSGFAVRLRVTPAPEGGVQRLDLPVAAIAALRTRDGVDVRVFDARGRAVPIARVAPATQLRRDALSASPILGPSDTPVGARISMQFDASGRPRMAEVEGAGATRGEVVLLGALLDARTVGGTADRLELDVDVPAGQPVRFTVEATPDLENWRTLGQGTVYRTPGTASAGGAVALGGAALRRDYLRVTWRAASRLIAPVTVRSAVLVTSASGQQDAIAAKLPALVDDHAVEFIAPITALAWLRVVPAATDGATSIRVLGRDDAEQPWSVLASGVATATGGAMTLGGAAPRRIRIEADRRGPGFSAAPGVELGFAPQALAFVGSGGAAFTLAAGRADTPDAFVPLQSLSPPAGLPQAMVEPGVGTAPIVLEAPDGARETRLRLMLWAVLLAAVALLGGLVWSVWRRRDGAPEG